MCAAAAAATAAAPIRESACARVGLLGNPSDGYGGKALALAIADFRAEVTLSPSDGLRLVPGQSDALEFATARDAVAFFDRAGCEDGLRLVRAALHRFARSWSGWTALAPEDERLRFELRYTTTIPRQVGLAGSSAIVTAALRALARHFTVKLEPAELAEIALAVELEDLGIAAGAMDRVSQAYQGLMVMDLAEPRSAGSYRALAPELLPDLFVAWEPRGAEVSGRAHGDLRARWLRGDADVLDGIARLRALVDEGVVRLESADTDGFRDCMRRNFEARERVFDVSALDRRLVAIASAHGAVAKQCGSGGAVVGSAPDGVDLQTLARAYREAGFAWRKPRPAPLRESA